MIITYTLLGLLAIFVVTSVIRGQHIEELRKDIKSMTDSRNEWKGSIHELYYSHVQARQDKGLEKVVNAMVHRSECPTPELYDACPKPVKDGQCEHCWMHWALTKETADSPKKVCGTTANVMRTHPTTYMGVDLAATVKCIIPGCDNDSYDTSQSIDHGKIQPADNRCMACRSKGETDA